ncbi:hypothetical protein DPEC_G00350520 [Dallia pectoralis]|uniref:Uncharacterized protein n=1 Tax=Dallia pectoralis TaxID=75939 RepID=A0ACC2F1Q9_DALPE|nr:hypothetical protein DPEC_G00350520 [Dallia pectoralis]
MTPAPPQRTGTLRRPELLKNQLLPGRACRGEGENACIHWGIIWEGGGGSEGFKHYSSRGTLWSRAGLDLDRPRPDRRGATTEGPVRTLRWERFRLGFEPSSDASGSSTRARRQP